MAEVKNIFKVIHFIALLFWGLNIVEIFKKTFVIGLNSGVWGVFEDSIKLFMAIAGLVYFIIKIIHAYKSNKLDRIIKQQQIDITYYKELQALKDEAKRVKKERRKSENGTKS